MIADPPTEAEVLAYFETLSNWGRWGDDDERGTLNLISVDRARAAALAVRHGVLVGCARPIVREGPVADVTHPPLHHMIKSGEAAVSSVADGDTRQSTSSDFLGIVPHGFTVSHVDALSHVFWDDHLYNGFPRQRVTTAEGATVCSVEVMKDGVVTRGVLFDVARHRGVVSLEAGDAIGPEELEAIEAETGAVVGEGDALLLRTGWSAHRESHGVDSSAPRHRPGLHAACLPWLRERGVAVVASDASNDVEPSGYPHIRMPVHSVGMVAMGLCLVDNCQFEDLAALCVEYGQTDFLFMMAPMRFRHATGSPVTPLALL